MSAGGGDRDVTFRAAFEGGEAVEGLKSVETGVESLKTEIKTVPAAASELDEAMTRAAAAVAKLSDPKLSPIALQRAVLQADIATEGLAEAMKKAAATGGPTPPEMTAKVKQFEAAVTSANARAGALRDRLADLRVKGDQAAQGFEKMTQYGGSATSMMQGLADSSTGVVGGFGKAALAVFGFVEALKLGFEAGNKIRAAYKEWFGTEMPNLTNWFVKLGTGVDNATGAFDRHGVVARSAIGIHNENRRAITELTDKLKLLAPEWDRSANALKSSVEFGGILDGILKKLSADHQDVSKFAKAHAESIIEHLAPALKSGTITVMSMSVEMRAAVRAALDAVDAEKKYSEAIAIATQKIQEKFAAEELAIAKNVVAAEKEIESANLSIQTATRERDAKIKALNEMTLSDEEYNKRKREIVKETAEKVDEAGDKEAEAQDKITEAQKEYNEKLAASQKAITDATEGIKEQAKAYDTVKTAMTELDERFDPMVAQLGNVEKAIGKVPSVSDKAAERLKALREEIDRTADAAKRLDEALNAGSGRGTLKDK